ncbi:MAG: dihydroorotate dehydrogenase electron transfer subunit [Ferroplasma sp.]
MKYYNILKVRKDSENVATISIDGDEVVKPGQFIMAWVPGMNMIPLSFSSVSSPKEITVKAYGPPSAHLTQLKAGERLFFEGPFGNGFNIVNGKKLLIGAGTGIAPLIPLIDENTYGLISGRTATDLILEDRFHPERLLIATDDGTMGRKGYATDVLRELNLEKFEMLYVCGPEIMLKSVYDYIKDMKVAAQFSLERPMKCGIGICDSCSINGYQVCRDGPVFTKEQLSHMDEFGRTRLKYSGKRIYF